MKAIILPINASEINKFLATPGLRIGSKHIIPPDQEHSESMLLVFCETPEDDAAAKDRALIEQNSQMDRLIEIARQVAKDEKYGALKNSTQREIFLFSKYNVPKTDAANVAALLTPEMASILGA